MRTDKIMHFVYFETTLDSEQFIGRWESYIRSEKSGASVILQEAKKDKLCRYISQHCCDSGEFLFTFTKAAKTNRSKEVEVKTMLLGGYSILQDERSSDTKANESKVFVFLNYSNKNFEHYKEAAAYGKLNIYEAYYENCVYAYILEYFIKDTHIELLKKQLQQYGSDEIMVYKECNLKTA